MYRTGWSGVHVYNYDLLATLVTILPNETLFVIKTKTKLKFRLSPNRFEMPKEVTNP